MTRLVIALLAGLLGAGIVHIVAVLAVPRLADADLVDRAEALGARDRFVALPQDDPMLRAALCLVALDEPARVFAGGDVPFWSASVVTPTGISIYSTNDRTARERTLDVIVLNAGQVDTLREELSEDAPELVAVDAGEAIVVLRALVPDATFAPAVEALLGEASCAPLEIDLGTTGALAPPTR